MSPKEPSSIVLVEQKEEIINVVKTAAERAGFSLIIAEDGQEGFDIAMERPPVLMMVRCDAPILDAPSLSLLLKQSNATKDVPILVICSEISASEHEKYQDAGCNDCLKEPFSVSDLLKIFKEWLQ